MLCPQPAGMIYKRTFCLLFFSAGLLLVTACGEKKKSVIITPPGAGTGGSQQHFTTPPFSLPVPDASVVLTKEINSTLSDQGAAIYRLKCQSCHKQNEEKLVGPGLQNIMQRRSPGWLMSLLLYTQEMLDNDPESKKILELYKVRMTNPSLSRDEARAVLEFLRTLN